MPPAYYKYGDKEVINFYSRIVNKIPECEIILYNFEKLCGYKFSSSCVEILAKNFLWSKTSLRDLCSLCISRVFALGSSMRFWTSVKWTRRWSIRSENFFSLFSSQLLRGTDPAAVGPQGFQLVARTHTAQRFQFANTKCAQQHDLCEHLPNPTSNNAISSCGGTFILWW